MAYNLTPSLRAVATVNTDFAETEVDQRLVNLTRFPLFLPERRTFFLDGSTFFDLPFNSFFSRRIGLVEGVPQPIIGGTKLNGQAGRNDVGALYVRTADEDRSPGESFLVARWRRRVLRQSYFGAFYTGRATHDGSTTPARHTAGADFRFSTATFLGQQEPHGGRLLGGQLHRRRHRRQRRLQRPRRVSERHLGIGGRVPGSAEGLQPGHRIHAAPRVPPLQDGSHLESAAEDPPSLHPPLPVRAEPDRLYRPPEPETDHHVRHHAVPPRAP